MSSPNVVNGLVYVGSSDGTLYALHTKNGSKAWTFHTKGAITSSPAVFKGRVYVASFDGKVYALDAIRGTLLRAFKTLGPIQASPALASYGGVNWLIVGSTDHIVYAWNADTGALKCGYLTAGVVFSSVA